MILKVPLLKSAEVKGTTTYDKEIMAFHVWGREICGGGTQAGQGSLISLHPS